MLLLFSFFSLFFNRSNLYEQWLRNVVIPCDKCTLLSQYTPNQLFGDNLNIFIGKVWHFSCSQMHGCHISHPLFVFHVPFFSLFSSLPGTQVLENKHISTWHCEPLNCPASLLPSLCFFLSSRSQQHTRFTLSGVP